MIEGALGAPSAIPPDVAGGSKGHTGGAQANSGQVPTRYVMKSDQTWPEERQATVGNQVLASTWCASAGITLSGSLEAPAGIAPEGEGLGARPLALRNRGCLCDDHELRMDPDEAYIRQAHKRPAKKL